MNFRLQPILNLRKHREENCQIRLREEQVRLSRIHNEVVAWEERTKRQERMMEEFGTGRIDPTLLEQGSTYLTYVHGRKGPMPAAGSCAKRKRWKKPGRY